MLDASAFSGVWAFRSLNDRTLQQVIESLGAVGITGACITPVEAILTPEPMRANRRLFTEATTWQGNAHQGSNSFSLTLAPVVDPSLPAWKEHVQACLLEGGESVRAIKIFPNYHVYPMEAPFLNDLASILIEKGLTLCIQARMEDERSRHPLMTSEGVPAKGIAEFAGRHPELRVLVCGSTMPDLKAYEERENVHVELSMVESGRLLHDALARVGEERLLLGTHAPLFDPAVGVSKVTADDEEERVHRCIGTENFERLFSSVR